MPHLYELAKLIRSKNAGPFQLTFDIMFENAENYERVKAAGVITREWVARTYNLPLEDVDLIDYPAAHSIKVTVPRPVISGDIRESDIFGGQQYAPFVDLQIP